MLILFRPRFINSHFINLLTKKDFSQYNELDAASIDEINEVFYNKFYYLNPEASLVNLAKMTNIFIFLKNAVPLSQNLMTNDVQDLIKDHNYLKKRTNVNIKS